MFGQIQWLGRSVQVVGLTMPHDSYYFDKETLQWRQIPRRRVFPVVKLTVSVLVLAAVGAVVIDRTARTPEELALEEENQALKEQLARTETAIGEFRQRIDALAHSDQQLYRVILQADDISDEVRQVGVGGSDPYQEFDRFSASTARLLRSSATQLDQLERLISLQNSSYRELGLLARTRNEALAQLPAIMPVRGYVSSYFGRRKHPIYGNYHHHGGVDIPIARGSPIYATGGGIVKAVDDEPGGYGLHIIVSHPEAGYETLYAHLQSVPSGIRRGMRVKRGEQIALSGNSGRSTAPHVHYEVRDLGGRKLNPIRFFAPSMTPAEYQELLTLAKADTLGTSLD